MGAQEALLVDRLDAFVDVSGLSYDEAGMALAAGVSDPFELEAGSPAATETDYDALLAEWEGQHDGAIGVEAVSVAARTQQLYWALGALSRTSMLGGLARAAQHPAHAGGLEQRYNGQLPALVEGAAAKRSRLAQLVRPAFMAAATGNDAEASTRQDTLAEWRRFCNTFSGAQGAVARAAYRKKLEQVAATYGFELPEVA